MSRVANVHPDDVFPPYSQQAGVNRRRYYGGGIGSTLEVLRRLLRIRSVQQDLVPRDVPILHNGTRLEAVALHRQMVAVGHEHQFHAVVVGQTSSFLASW